MGEHKDEAVREHTDRFGSRIRITATASKAVPDYLVVIDRIDPVTGERVNEHTGEPEQDAECIVMLHSVPGSTAVEAIKNTLKQIGEPVD